jgi:hypothetical protein
MDGKVGWRLKKAGRGEGELVLGVCGRRRGAVAESRRCERDQEERVDPWGHRSLARPAGAGWRRSAEAGVGVSSGCVALGLLLLCTRSTGDEGTTPLPLLPRLGRLFRAAPRRSEVTRPPCSAAGLIHGGIWRVLGKEGAATAGCVPGGEGGRTRHGFDQLVDGGAGVDAMAEREKLGGQGSWALAALLLLLSRSWLATCCQGRRLGGRGRGPPARAPAPRRSRTNGWRGALKPGGRLLEALAARKHDRRTEATVMVRPRSATTALDRRSAPTAGASAPLAAAAGARAWWSEGQRPGAATETRRGGGRIPRLRPWRRRPCPGLRGGAGVCALARSLGGGSVQVYVAAARGSGGSALGR